MDGVVADGQVEDEAALWSKVEARCAYLQTHPALIQGYTLFHWWPGGCKGNDSEGFLRVLPHSSTPAILSKTRLRMRLWTKRIRFTRAARPQKDQASMR